MKDPRKVGIGMILSSLETAEQIATRMKYASVATQLAGMEEMFKSMNEGENE